MTKSQMVAKEAMLLNHIDGEPRRSVDTGFAKPFVCWVIFENEDGAIVVYGDDPKSVVSTGNHPGRFI